MAIKPIESYDEEEWIEPDNTGRNIVKMLFLSVVIVFGAFFGWYYTSYQEEIKERMALASVRPTTTITPTSALEPRSVTKTIPAPEKARDLGEGLSRLNTAAGSFNTPKQRDSAETNELLTQVQTGGLEVLQTSYQQVASIGGTVLGAATEQVKNTASSSAQMVTNSLYQSTIGNVILQLFNTLPDEAKKNVVEDICVETKECAIK